MISVIIPIYNEEKILERNASFFQRLSGQVELIFVDGGSIDRSVEFAASYSKVLRSEKGRARQMNYGIEKARHDTLLLLHADATLSAGVILSIEKQLSRNGIVGGCLTQLIDKGGVIYRVIEAQGNLRARLSKVFYGDQGIFVKKDVFLKIGGFPEVPIMEDVLFSRKLRHAGKTVVLADKIVVSPRRWERKGVIKTALLFNFIIILFRLGCPLEKIKLLYDDLR